MVGVGGCGTAVSPIRLFAVETVFSGNIKRKFIDRKSPYPLTVFENMAEDFIALANSEKKRKYGGGGEGRGTNSRGSKRQKWNSNPSQSGANTMPLGERRFDATAVEDQIDDAPSSISRSNVRSHSNRPPPDTSRWSEKRKKREAEKLKWKNREKELLQAVIAAQKAGTYKEETIDNKKKLRSDGNVALDESRSYYELHGGTIDKGEAHEYLKRINDHQAPYASHLPEDMDEADKALKQAKKEKKQLCPADEFVLKVARMNPSKDKKKKNQSCDDKVIKNSKGSKQPTVTEVLEREPKDGEDAVDGQTSEKKGRFICFVGQLPFTCTTADIEKHFSTVAPSSIRHMTHKEGGQSKGYAFLEFDNWDRMRTCLKLYHHSEFSDGKSKSRKINIELTSGGGGNSENRKDRITTKNEKLGKERVNDYANRNKDKNDGNPNMTKLGSGAATKGEAEKPMTKHERRMAKFAEDHRYTKTQRKKLEKQKKRELQKKNLERMLIDKIKAKKRAEAEAAKSGGGSGD